MKKKVVLCYERVLFHMMFLSWQKDGMQENQTMGWQLNSIRDLAKLSCILEKWERDTGRFLSHGTGILVYLRSQSGR